MAILTDLTKTAFDQKYSGWGRYKQFQKDVRKAMLAKAVSEARASAASAAPPPQVAAPRAGLLRWL